MASDEIAHSPRLAAARTVRVAAEAVVLSLVAIAPWPYASAQPIWEAAVALGVAAAAGLWCVHALLTRQLAFRFDLPTGCLVGMIVLAVAQLLPVPDSIVRIISPATAALHAEFLPAETERLSGEPADARPTAYPLSVEPYLTQVHLARVAAVLLAYLVARNFLAGRRAFRRLAWVVGVNCVLLAVFALAQFLTSPKDTVFWSVKTAGAVYGPFVCKNHYPDYVGFGLGMGAGLLVGAAIGRGKKAAAVRWVDLPTYVLESPGRIAGLVCVGLVAVSLPFSLSRGGTLAAVVAAAGTAVVVVRRGRVAARGADVALGLAVTGVLAAAVGLSAVGERLATLGGADALQGRWSVWRDSAPLVLRFPAAGTGMGTFMRVEPLDRTSVPPEIIYDQAHNEYLQAAVEGGLPGLLLAVGLAVGVLRLAARAVGRLAGRSAGPVAVGAFFGLALLAVHSAGDFGVKIPAVALVAAVVAGHAAAATAPGYLPAGGRSKKEPEADPAPAPRFVGPAAAGGAVLLLAAVVFVAAEARARASADRLRRHAQAAVDRPTDRVRWAAAWAELTPADPLAHVMHAEARFDLARANARPATLAAAGGWAAAAPGDPAADDPDLRAGLAAIRAARRAGMLLPEPHARLGRYAYGFAAAEPTRAHYDRAKKLLPVDGDVHFAAAGAAAAAGDRTAAAADWAAAVQLKPALARAVLVAAGRAGLSIEVVLSDVLGGDPVAATAAADALHPTPYDPARQPFLRAAVSAADKLPRGSVRQWTAAAYAAGELGESAAADKFWAKAVAVSPDDRAVWDAHARWLEAEERYAEALPLLIQLRDRDPTGRVYRDRIAAANHGLALAQAIGGK